MKYFYSEVKSLILRSFLFSQWKQLIFVLNFLWLCFRIVRLILKWILRICIFLQKKSTNKSKSNHQLLPSEDMIMQYSLGYSALRLKMLMFFKALFIISPMVFTLESGNKIEISLKTIQEQSMDVKREKGHKFYMRKYKKTTIIYKTHKI